MLLVPRASKLRFRRVEVNQFWEVCCRPYIYPKKSNFFTSNTHVVLLKKYGGKSSNYRDLFKRESLKLANVNVVLKAK